MTVDLRAARRPAEGAERLNPVIHFAHAGGFPAATYRTLFAERAGLCTVRVLDRIGHDPAYPVTRDWPCLVDQLLDDIARPAGLPVYLVGHSLGGYLSLMAVLKRPQWVHGVVMPDSPVIAGWRSGVRKVSQWTGLDEWLSPAAAIRTRRQRWSGRDDAWRHFRAKPAFARWDERVLSDYIDSGIPQVAADGSRALAFDRRIGYLVYRTFPHTLGARLARGAPVPVGLIAGTRSKEIRRIGLAATRRICEQRIAWRDGSHLYPMERPVETACAIQRRLQRLTQPAHDD